MHRLSTTFVLLPSCGSLQQQQFSSPLSARYYRSKTVLSKGRRAMIKMLAEKSVDEERPPEPYPGFYNDMLRAGLSEEQARDKASKTSGQKGSQSQEQPKTVGKKSLVGPDGKPLAPWMKVEDAPERSPIRSRSDARGRLAADPQQQELSGQGLAWRMLGDELELRWSTGNEENNKGFIVSRRPGKAENWETVSTWRDKPAELASKSPDGATYSFIVPDPTSGAWVYRVSDEDGDGKISDLSQTLVDVESAEDSKVRTVALLVLIVVILAFLGYGFLADPLSGTS